MARTMESDCLIYFSGFDARFHIRFDVQGALQFGFYAKYFFNIFQSAR